MRMVVDELSTPYRPYHPFDENLLASGEVVPVEICLWPMALRFHPGEQLSLTISAYTVPSADSQMGLFGSAIVPVPEDGGMFVLGANVSLNELGGPIRLHSLLCQGTDADGAFHLQQLKSHLPHGWSI